MCNSNVFLKCLEHGGTFGVGAAELGVKNKVFGVFIVLMSWTITRIPSMGANPSTISTTKSKTVSTMLRVGVYYSGVFSEGIECGTMFGAGAAGMDDM